MYMGKVQQGSWSLTTTDHDVEIDDVGAFGTESISSHQEQLAFSISLQYPSFNLNDSIVPNINDLSSSSNGDGCNDGTCAVDSGGNSIDNGGNNAEGGIGVPINAVPSGNVIRSVIHYIDEGNINNDISNNVTGDDFPDEHIK